MSGFPDTFLWGAAASAYQIEGGSDADGKGPSIWDQFCRQEGKIQDGSSGWVACDHYARMPEDVAIMSEIGLQAYRFSLSWPRIFPSDPTGINTAGLDFYDRLVDELLASGIEPFATLYHWDLPVWAQDRGGWLNPDIPKWFERYTQAVVERISDRVSNWFTLNEPQCFIGLGLEKATHAPGYRLPFSEVLVAAHHCLLAHGRSVRAIREFSILPSQVGAAPTGSGVYPVEETPENIRQAAEATFAVNTKALWNFAWFTDPIFRGHYPEDGLRLFGSAVPDYTPDEMRLISQPLDFCGLNLYNGWGIDAAGAASTRGDGHAMTAYKWPVTPEVLYWTPRFFHERYGLPIYITENGCSSMDWVDCDVKVRDYGRIDFLRRYLAQLRRAAEEGIPLGGYFLWSLMDNFEWASGYRERFGIVHVDFQTQRRTLKESARWYAEVIANHGSDLGLRGLLSGAPEAVGV